jgi:hypothetical protein
VPLALFVVSTSVGAGDADSAGARAAVEEPATILPQPSSQVVYVVRSQQQADNLMAFGLPSAGVSDVVPEANVSVLVVDSSATQTMTRVAMQRVMDAYLSNAVSPTTQFVDLR